MICDIPALDILNYEIMNCCLSIFDRRAPAIESIEYIRRRELARTKDEEQRKILRDGMSATINMRMRFDTMTLLLKREIERIEKSPSREVFWGKTEKELCEVSIDFINTHRRFCNECIFVLCKREYVRVKSEIEAGVYQKIEINKHWRKSA